MPKKQVFKKKRRVQKVGGSLMVTIPFKIAEEADIGHRDNVAFEFNKLSGINMKKEKKKI